MQKSKCKMTDEVLQKILEKIDIINRQYDRGFRASDSYRFGIDGEDFFLLDVIETLRERIEELQGLVDTYFGSLDAGVNPEDPLLLAVKKNLINFATKDKQVPAEGKEAADESGSNRDR